jgi:hypothetical protein
MRNVNSAAVHHGASPAFDVNTFSFGAAVAAETRRVEINMDDYPRIALFDPELTHTRWKGGNPSFDILSLATHVASLADPSTSPLTKISLALQARVVNQNFTPTIMMFGGGSDVGRPGMGVSTASSTGHQVPFTSIIQVFRELDPNKSNGQHAVVSIEAGSFIGVYSKAAFGDMV